jgi:hypothetical protein
MLLSNLNESEKIAYKQGIKDAQEKVNKWGYLWGTVGAWSIIALISGLMWIFPVWNVWRSTLSGEAELKKAEWNRQVTVKEAMAKEQAAMHLAGADTLRAHGEARANFIIGNSLVGERGQARLRYLWIHNVGEGSKASVIYVPTEANLPILEAMRMREVTP